jgi:RNA polymerase sigma-70 factor (ECF subfamily)
MQDIKDELVAKKVQEGETELYGILIERYEEKLKRYASKFIQSKDDVTDIVQDVFTKAFINIQGYDSNQAFSSWVYRIAHNECVNHIKKRKFKPFSFFDFEVDEILPQFRAKEETDSETSQKLDKKLLDEALKDLDPKYREIIVLHYYEELSYKAIGTILHIPTTLVGVRLKRAREAVEKALVKKGITYEKY